MNLDSLPWDGQTWTPIGEVRDVDIELTTIGPIAEATRALVPGPDPCESCGTRISLIDPLALVRVLGGSGPRDCRSAEPRQEWMEQRMLYEPGRVAMQLRPHTPERCKRVRAGDPEPWEDIDDDHS